MGICCTKSVVFIGIVCSAVPAFAQPATASGANCTFQASPDAFLSAQARAREDVYQRIRRLQPYLAAAAPVRTRTDQTDSNPIPHRNFIDDEIFGQLAKANVAPAALTSDEEFFRRINLDLTGRIPTPADIRAFVADTTPNKRDAVIDKLLASPEFTDKWTMWLGDLMQNTVTLVTANLQHQIDGRNAFFGWIYWSVYGNKPLKDIAYQALTAAGNNYDYGPANFIMNGSAAGGPIQDTYDGMLVRAATSFLGMAHYDCLCCHNGRGHLDQISLWGSQTTRMQAEQMAAFFARTRLTRYPAPNPPPGQASTDPHYNSTIIEDAVSGNYLVNTNYGNRPNRVPYGTVNSLTPVYHFSGATPAGPGWRGAFADNMIQDPMFARNFANRLWKQMFSLGLVDPVDTLDPARLDPSNPPPDPWTFQATHPVLLEKLANYLAQSNFDLRAFLKLLAQSSAYQLSSRYDGDWTLEDVPLFARHYPRRLEGEEIHDAIQKATGVINKYAVQDWGDPIQWAMQLPEPVEPRTNGAAAAFMNAFLRGNRDTAQRNQATSILQQLNLMNDNFVTSRTRVAASPVLQNIAKITDDGAAFDELFLTFLSRLPTQYERDHGLAFLAKATTPAARNTAIEDLAWTCINKLQFMFSY